MSKRFAVIRVVSARVLFLGNPYEYSGSQADIMRRIALASSLVSRVSSL